MASWLDREQRLDALSDPEFDDRCSKLGGVSAFVEGQNRRDWRAQATDQYLHYAENDPSFADKFDRLLGLPTDAEIQEERLRTQADASVRSANAAERAVRVSWIAIVISVIALVAALRGWIP